MNRHSLTKLSVFVAEEMAEVLSNGLSDDICRRVRLCASNSEKISYRLQ